MLNYLAFTPVKKQLLSFAQATESELGDVDLSGLPEAAVDSEEEEEEDEDLERASATLLGRDLVRECLEKDPADRNDDDIGQCDTLLQFELCLKKLLIGLPKLQTTMLLN